MSVSAAGISCSSYSARPIRESDNQREQVWLREASAGPVSNDGMAKLLVWRCWTYTARRWLTSYCAIINIPPATVVGAETDPKQFTEPALASAIRTTNRKARQSWVLGGWPEGGHSRPSTALLVYSPKVRDVGRRCNQAVRPIRKRSWRLPA